MFNTALIIGANSDMAKALALEIAHQFKPSCFLLASQNRSALDAYAAQLRTHTSQPEVVCFTLDVTDYAASAAFYQHLPKAPDLVIYAAGYLGDERLAQTNAQEARKILDVNYTGAMILLDLAAEDFAKRKTGTIVGITSVAGLVGKKSNYHYGAAKAAFITYLNGLRARLRCEKVHVMTVIPGYTRTKMTAHMKLPKTSLLTATSSSSAKRMCSALCSKKAVLFVPSLWRYLMALLPKTFLANL